MKRLINPPIQTLLWLVGFTCLLAAAWSIWQLRAMDVDLSSAANVKVDIPDANALSVPPVNRYRQLVDAPLFWEARAVPRKEPPSRLAVAPKPEVVEVELIPPKGRLVGIVDLGSKVYALVRNDEENLSLYKGDKWEGWTVSDINSEKVVLIAGKQKAEIPLIGDFSAPKENQQIALARKRDEQRRKHLEQRQRLANETANLASQNQSVPELQPAAENASNAAGAENANGGEEAAPVLTIKEALEARQRLMASRWGSRKPKE